MPDHVNGRLRMACVVSLLLLSGIWEGFKACRRRRRRGVDDADCC
jgi:hypothetical protein